MEKYFKPAKDLSQDEINIEQPKEGKLRFSHNLQEKYGKQNTSKIKSKREKIEEYLKSIVSEPDDGELIEAGSKITTIDKLSNLIEEGYIITEATYLNENLVSISFQKSKKRRRKL